jgi:hypothetical protein
LQLKLIIVRDLQNSVWSLPISRNIFFSASLRLNLARHKSLFARGANLLAILWLFCACQFAVAQETGPGVEKVSIGFGGKYKVGYWTQVRLDILAGSSPFSGKLSLEIPDAEGGPCIWTSAESEQLTLAPQQRATIVRYVKFGRLENRLTAILESVEGNTQKIRLDAKIGTPSPTTARHALHLGAPLDWETVTRQRRLSGRESAEVMSITKAIELPEIPLGYDGLDFIALTTSDLTLLQQCTPTQRDALAAWVKAGGRMLLSVGKNGEAILGKDGLLAGLAPGKWVGVVNQGSMKGLESFVHAEVRLDSVGGARDRDFSLPLALIAEHHGRMILDEAGEDGKPRPEVISTSSGFGQLVFVAVDLAQYPFSKEGDRAAWDSTPVLLEKLIDELMGQSARSANEGGNSGNLGYGDLAGQFQTALDHFSGVSLVPFSALVALIIGYGLMVTVADYFFLRKLVKRMQWTWLTFPLIAIVFCAIALGIVRNLRKPDPQARQVEIVDIDAADGNVRGRSWLHVYSPVTDAYSVSFSRENWSELTGEQSAVCWHGMPGKGVGGMDRRALTSVFDEPYTQSPPGAGSAIVGLPIQFASSRRLLDEWSAKLPITVASELKTDDGAYLRGSFVNSTAQPLDRVLLLYRGSAYRYSSPIGPGGRQFIDPSEAPLNLNWLATQRRTIETKDVNTPWDPASEDIARLVEMFTLHEAAGADSYTGLSNRFYRSLDLSEHAAKGQAVLYGRVKQPISKPTIQAGIATTKPIESVETWTFVRILIPVTFERKAH